MIGLVALGASGRLLAEEIHAAWPDTTRIHQARVSACFGPTEALAYALDRHDLVVCLAPVAATVRLYADGLPPGRRRPGLVSLDLDLRYAVPLTGRDTGAEELAVELAALLGVRAVLTGTPAPAGGDAPADAPPASGLRQTDRQHGDQQHGARQHRDQQHGDQQHGDRTRPAEGGLPTQPRSLVVGVGAGARAEHTEVIRLLLDALRDAGLSRGSVARLATVTGKADHPAVRWAAFCLGSVPVDEHPADVLATVAVPNPSDLVGAAVGSPSVAEAAALASAPGGELVVAKRKSALATVAVARSAVRGRLALVGLGPGEPDLLVPRAAAELRRVHSVVGPVEAVGAVESIAGLLRPGTRRITAGDHARTAVDLASLGQAVALVALGDGTGLAVPPGPYDVHRVPGLPGHPQGDPA
ncbi:cobalamin biosynthesis protein [Kitasatospora sp. NPDC101176]|uniref:cobalamin biosynthesis protein n=1 Tax=Kitasatospora sp. NPDC101176 TaxID=3364099 RepID=UPI0037F5680C